MSEKPDVDPHLGDAPADLEVTDLFEGDGTEATSGSTVSVHYVGVAHSTGEEFDASYNRGTPLQFRLGIGQVISGWDSGVQGMKVGGRRRLVIPPHLGYGDRGGMTRRRRPPTFMPWTPESQPEMTWPMPRRNCSGVPRL